MRKPPVMDIEYEKTDKTPDFADDDLNFLDNIESGGIDNTNDIPLEKHKDLLKKLTDFAKYLKETVHEWLGLRYDQKNNAYIRDENLQPIMNIQGAVWCVNFMKTYARENNIITDISKEHYTYMMLDIIDTIWSQLITKAEDFEIKTNTDILSIANKLEHTAALVLMGAGDGRYNKFLQSTYHHTSTNTDQPRNELNPQAQQLRRQTMLGRLKKVVLG